MTISLLPPWEFIRFMESILLTAAFWIIGYFFILLFYDVKTIPTPLHNFGATISAGLVLTMMVVIGLSFFRIPVNKANLSIFFLGFYGISVIRLYGKKSNFRISVLSRIKNNLFDDVLPVLLFVIVLILRIRQINDILVPNWYDGLTHTSLLDQYLTNAKIPLDNIYHVGFHAIAMAVYYFLGLSESETILLLGQWLGAACGLTLYYLFHRYTQNKYIAGLCFIVYSSLLLFPSYLSSLSRYPFLLGLTLLPPAIITTMEWIANSKSNYWMAVFFLVTLGLAHYGSLLFWFAYIFSHMLNNLFNGSNIKLNLLKLEPQLKRFTLLITPLMIVIFPKTISLLHHPSVLTSMIERFQDSTFDIGAQVLLEKFLSQNFIFFLLWIVCLPLSFFIARRSLFLTWLWPFTTWFFIWVQYRFLGLSISSYANLIIFLSIPVAFTLGFFIKESSLYIRHANSVYSLRISRYFLRGLPPILLIASVLLATFLVPPNIDHEKTLLTNDDLAAMNWIKRDTSVNSGFLVRTTIWSNKSLVPYDGGGWITFITGRRIIIPQIGDLYDLCEFSKKNNVNYMYFGNKPSAETFDLKPDDLPSEIYSVAYQNGTVKIFSLHCS